QTIQATISGTRKTWLASSSLRAMARMSSQASCVATTPAATSASTVATRPGVHATTSTAGAATAPPGVAVSALTACVIRLPALQSDEPPDPDSRPPIPGGPEHADRGRPFYGRTSAVFITYRPFGGRIASRERPGSAFGAETVHQPVDGVEVPRPPRHFGPWMPVGRGFAGVPGGRSRFGLWLDDVVRRLDRHASPHFGGSGIDRHGRAGAGDETD